MKKQQMFGKARGSASSEGKRQITLFRAIFEDEKLNLPAKRYLCQNSLTFAPLRL
jgi:hypothetical protein